MVSFSGSDPPLTFPRYDLITKIILKISDQPAIHIPTNVYNKT